MDKIITNGAMLNAYPDSLGGNLENAVNLLSNPKLENVFESFYILPSMFNTDLDRGFSVIDYNLNEELVNKEDIEQIKALGINLKLDFILNHLSVLSPQFKDLLKNGESSNYKDFFINWNEFWKGNGKLNDKGYIEPNKDLIKDMFFRKEGLPILMVKMPDGTNVPYWNTFYQEIKYKELDTQDLMELLNIQYGSAQKLAEHIKCELNNGKKPNEIDFMGYNSAVIIKELEQGMRYLGQMDLNIKSPLVWEFYDEVLKTFYEYGAKIVRLDAFAYAPKEVGKRNFLNDPDTWEALSKVSNLAEKYELSLLPEIHATYGEKIHETLHDKGYMTYDFFMPGLIIEAIENKNPKTLIKWANEIMQKGMRTVNMLGCHDGIPLLDLKGLLEENDIQNLIELIVSRGGYVKELHGQKNMYYQVNATYFSALGEDIKKMHLARAIQLFMPGKPQIWYLDLYCGKNDHEAVKKAGAGGHKEINRTNIDLSDLHTKIDMKQIELIKLRNTHKAFGFDSDFSSQITENRFVLAWKNGEHKISLDVDLTTLEFKIEI